MWVRTIALSFLLVLVGQCASAEEMKMPMNAKDLTWGPPPPVLPKGAPIAVVLGVPSKTAHTSVRIKLPNGYQVPAHNHPNAKSVTVLSGKFNPGNG